MVYTAIIQLHRRGYFRTKMQHFTQGVMFFLVASIPIDAKQELFTIITYEG